SSYRCADELAGMATRDPILRLRKLLLDEGLAQEEELDRIVADVETEVAVAADRALSHPQPPPEAATRWLYSESVDPTSSSFDTEHEGVDSDRKEYTMVDLLNACLRDEMEQDPRIVIFGQDVADASREILDEVSGKGGVFKVTHGL